LIGWHSTRTNVAAVFCAYSALGAQTDRLIAEDVRGGPGASHKKLSHLFQQAPQRKAQRLAYEALGEDFYNNAKG
jgi:hypothetical protein